jgi:hypothetical protein
MRLNIDYLGKALSFAHGQDRDVRSLPLEEAIEVFYAKRESFKALSHKELLLALPSLAGDEKKEFFEAVLDEVVLTFPEDVREGYKCALGKYFSCFPRKKRVKEKWKPPEVLEADSSRVVFQVYPELQATFFSVLSAASKEQLGWGDIGLTREVLSGSPYIGDAMFVKLKKQALAILNDYRVRRVAA